MKIYLDVKNPGKVVKPTRNDLVIYDGKNWYVTTKDDLLAEFNEKLVKKGKELDAKIAECDKKIAEVDKLKADVAKQLLTFGDIVRDLVSKEDK